eukprot:9489817-Lingulodinium_polyedra.AAC.1
MVSQLVTPERFEPPHSHAAAWPPCGGFLAPGTPEPCEHLCEVLGAAAGQAQQAGVAYAQWSSR